MSSSDCDYIIYIQFYTPSFVHIYLPYFNEKDKPALTGARCTKKVKTIINRIRKGTDIEQRTIYCVCRKLKPN